MIGLINLGILIKLMLEDTELTDSEKEGLRNKLNQVFKDEKMKFLFTKINENYICSIEIKNT
jgi:hypothetical protein